MRNRIIIFWFRLFSLIDVLFSAKFELTTYTKDGSKNAITKFDKKEILKRKTK